MKWIIPLKAFMRYWRMAQDPRTPGVVRLLVYAGIFFTVAPKKLRPQALRMDVLDEAALVPSLIALAMVLIPSKVKEEYDRVEKKEIKEQKAEGEEQAEAASPGAALASGV